MSSDYGVAMYYFVHATMQGFFHFQFMKLYWFLFEGSQIFLQVVHYSFQCHS
jgi:hypothetical protein